MDFHEFTMLTAVFAETITDEAVTFTPRKLQQLLSTVAAQAAAGVLWKRAAYHEWKVARLVANGLVEDLIDVYLWHTIESYALRKFADAQFADIAGGRNGQ